MAFDQATFAPVSSHSSNTPNVYSYKTDDSLTDVQGAAYFADKSAQVENGDFFMIFASDGNAIFRSIGGDLLALTSSGLTNVTVVEVLADFPTPISGVITLEEDILYQINGFVNIGTNRIVVNGNNAIIGQNGGHDAIIYTGTGDMFTLGAGEAMSLIALTIGFDNGTCFNLDGGGNGRLFVQQNCSFVGGGELGSIASMQFVQFDNCLFLLNTDGFTFSGADNARLSFTQNTISANTGTFLDLTTGVWESIVINGNQAVNTPSGAVFLSGAAGSANVSNAGLVENNIFAGDGTYLDTITNEDLKWEFQGNKGNNGTQNSQREGGAFISTPAATVITTGSGDAGNPIPILGTFTEKIAKRFTVSAAGVLTYIGLEEVSVNIMVIADLDPASGANKVYKIGIDISGTVDAGSQIQVSVDNNNPSPVSCQFPVAMTTGDTAQAFIECITDETNVTATSLSIVAR